MGLLRNSSWTDRRDHRDQETRYSKVMFGSAKKASHDVFIYLLVVKCHHFSLWFQHWFFRWWDWFIMFSMGWNCRKQKLGCLFYLRYFRGVFILSHSDCLQLERDKPCLEICTSHTCWSHCQVRLFSRWYLGCLREPFRSWQSPWKPVAAKNRCWLKWAKWLTSTSKTEVRRPRRVLNS
jgi:hypothetical protein